MVCVTLKTVVHPDELKVLQGTINHTQWQQNDEHMKAPIFHIAGGNRDHLICLMSMSNIWVAETVIPITRTTMGTTLSCKDIRY